MINANNRDNKKNKILVTIIIVLVIIIFLLLFKEYSKNDKNIFHKGKVNIIEITCDTNCNCECEKCGFIAKQPFDKCPKCGETEHIALYDRVIGYLTKIKNWSEGRQIEQKTRVYSKEVE